MKALFVKHLNSLVPTGQAAEDLLAKWKMGDKIMVEVRRPRNPQHHRLFFALAKAVVDNTDRYKTVDLFVAACKIYAGHYDEIQMTDGRVGLIPKSISFESMSQDEFDPFFDRALDLASKVLSVDAPTIRDEIMEMAA